MRAQPSTMSVVDSGWNCRPRCGPWRKAWVASLVRATSVAPGGVGEALVVPQQPRAGRDRVGLVGLDLAPAELGRGRGLDRAAEHVREHLAAEAQAEHGDVVLDGLARSARSRPATCGDVGVGGRVAAAEAGDGVVVARVRRGVVARVADVRSEMPRSSSHSPSSAGGPDSPCWRTRIMPRPSDSSSRGQGADPAAEVHQPARGVEGDDGDDAVVVEADGDVGLDQLDPLCAGRRGRRPGS